MTIKFLFIITSLFFVQSADAGSVIKTSGKKIYIVFDPSEGGTFQQGDYFNITTSNGKKIGVVELTSVRGYKAIGTLKKGKAAKGNGTLFRSVGKKVKMKRLDGTVQKQSKLDESEEDEDYSYKPTNAPRWGIQAGYGIASQDVKQDAGTSSQTGSSLSVKGLLDYPFTRSLSLRAALGAEIFSVSGTGQHAQTQQLNADISSKINFLSLDTLIKWSLMSGKSTQFYLLGGIGILHPLSKSSDSIDPNTISSLAVGEFGAGFELKVGKTSIPIDVLYYLFPESDTVSTSLISIRFGMFF